MKLPPMQRWADLDAEARRRVLTRPVAARRDDIRASVAKIIAAVRREGDAALRRLTREYDGVELAAIEVSAEAWESALTGVADEAWDALRVAHGNLQRFHAEQIPRDFEIETQPWILCARRFLPLDAVGLYIPGGTAPLCSTVLMLGAPAQLAGVGTRILATPPSKDGGVDPHILAAARLAGVQRVFAVGGAQAIAALAYGTDAIPKVDKLFGPGNAWVTEAKSQCAADPDAAASDLPAGPSEVLVIADAAANARFVASDLLSQAEHDADAQVVLITIGDATTAIRAEVESQCATLPRRDIAEASLAHSRWLGAATIEEAMALANTYAPEHLILHLTNARDCIGAIRHAGSVFIGPWTPESVGDYASGTNHVLPTYGHARTTSGVGVEAFGKFTTFQELTPEGLRGLANTVETLASLESLDAHRRAVQWRREAIEDAP